MRSFLRKSFVVATLLWAQSINAQYCTPSITTGGIYISFAGFGSPYGNIPGGSNHNTGAVFNSEGYANRSASSSGTVSRNCSNGYFFSIQSCGNQGAKNFNFRIYADWNQDNDFDDAGELAYERSNTIVNGNCAFYNTTAYIVVPANANSGTIRMRWAVREGGSAATACGGYTGEIEDYSIVVNGNTAPVLNNTGVPIMNALAETQTTNSGTRIGQLLKTTEPAVTLITETDACSSVKGIAITATSGAAGVWQYKLASGSWTNMGSVTGANALLLRETDYIRFVPSGPGSASISFRAWDMTVSTNGQYYNISSTGGSTSFSSAEESASLMVYSSAAVASDISVYLPAYSGSELNVVTTSLNPVSGIFKHSNAITSDNTSGFAYDMALDAPNNKLYWLGGTSFADLMRSNTNGTNVESLISGTFSYPTGVAIGNNKVFIAEYGDAIYTANLDGSALTAITGGVGQATDIGDLADIEYYEGKIYYFNQPGYAGGFKIFEANSDGTGTVELLTISEYPYGLDVINGTLYWTEMGGGNAYLRSRAISGGTVATLTTSASRYFYDLLVNTTNNKIYFTDGASSGNNAYLNSIPLAGGAITKELLLDNDFSTVVFNRSLITLPVHFINVKAWVQGNANKVEWNVAEETGVSHYTVERSAEGRNFTAVGTVSATQSSRYQWADAFPIMNNNFYRIHSVDHDGKKKYSAIVKVNRDEQIKNITAFPTISNNGRFVLRLQNIQEDSYQLSVFGNTGQQVYSQRIIHTGGSSAQTIILPNNLARGMYRIIVTGTNELYSQSIQLQ